MKKLTTILTACLFVFALSSCGGDADGSKVSGSEASGSEASGESENSVEDVLSPLEKLTVSYTDCTCEYQGMMTKMSDSDNLDALTLQIQELSVKCEEIYKNLEVMMVAADDDAKEGAMLLVAKGMQDCEYQ